MGDHPSPVAAELAEARDRAAFADPDQLELLADQVPGRDPGTAVALARRVGRGRPRGSLNKRNAKFRDQLLALYGHPAETLARAATTPVELLAAQLGCSMLEAASLSMRAAAELMPYLEQKRPVEIEISTRSDVVLVMPGGPMLEGVAQEVNEAIEAGIMWDTAAIEEALPSLTGTPLQDVSRDDDDQRETGAQSSGGADV